MTLRDYWEAMGLAHDAAERALDLGDDETHFAWAKAYHRLARRCLEEHGVELRPTE